MITANQLESFEGFKTPFYHYDLDHLSATLKQAMNFAGQHGYHIHYALKANTDDAILKTMVDHGIGADCVSGGELLKAIEVGFKPENIAFAGVGKADWEIELAFDHSIFTLNVESIEELRVVDKLAQRRGYVTNIALRLNPDVDANTHHYITTGLEENKFGISGWQVSEVMTFLRQSSNVNLVGLHFHIGSQIRDLEPFKNLCARINIINQQFLEAGFHIEHINAGGGLGIDYQRPDDLNNPNFESFFGLFNRFLELSPNQQLHFELGRSLVANCGDLISRVLYVKRGVKTNFLILDAGMTELIRPALYQSVHRIDNLSKAGNERSERYDVVGPVCESSDCFGKAIMMPSSERGDLIAIRSAGAYGASMASNYNLRILNDSFVSKS